MKRVFYFVVLLTMVVQTGFLSGISVHAQGEITETPTPTVESTPTPEPTATASPTDSPTPSATETLTPTATETSTATATVAPPVVIVEGVALNLFANPNVIRRGEELSLEWNIEGLGDVGKGMILRFHLQEGLTVIDPKIGTLNETGDTLDVEITELKGSIRFMVGEKVTSPLVITAELLQEEKPLAKAEVRLIEADETIVEAQGGSADGMGEKVKVAFPSGALNETVKVTIQKPSKTSLPIHSLSGSPFEVTAIAEESKVEVSQFLEPVEIQVKYDETELSGDEDDLRLFWFDPTDQQWKLPLSQRVDMENNVLYAYTDHFTVFDTYNSGWQSAETPTMDFFQQAGYSGAASFSMPIKVPPGPGGFQPSLSLSYNSQVVDSATTDTQASWVGMGWSLDAAAYIERNGFGTKSTDDDSYNLTLQGMGGTIWRGTDGRYHLENENFAKITYNATTDVWTVLDKQGNQYYFEESVGYTKDIECPNSSSNVHEVLTWRWMLTRAVNIFGKEITYSYVQEGQSFNHFYPETGCTTAHVVTNFIYPNTIQYANGRYRVRFIRTERYDYKPEWLTLYAAGVYKTFQKSLLSSIRVEQDADGDGTFETLIRKYGFTYCEDSSCSIFPAYVWPSLQNYRTPTLKTVREYGVGGTNSLPPYSFEYEDGMHLSQATNGYGGTVNFTYDTWYKSIPFQNWSNGWLEDDLPRWGNPLKCTFQDSQCDWVGIEGEGLVGGGNNGYIRVTGKAEKPIYSYQPGRWYRIVAGVKRPDGFADGKLQFGYSYKVNNVLQPAVYQSALVTSTGLRTLESQPFFLPRDTTSFKVLINSLNANETAGYNDLYWYYLEPLPTYSRVRSRTLSAGGDSYAFTYDYEGPNMNTTVNSAAANTPHPYTAVYSEFRGHAAVIETDPYGKQVTTQYGQTDCDNGRTLGVTVENANGVTMQSSSTTYGICTDKPTTQVVLDTEWPFGGTAFTGIGYKVMFVDNETSRVYDASESEVGYITTQYAFNATYGNLTQKVVSGADIDTLTTIINYSPNVSEGKWLVGLPSRVEVQSGGSTLAISLNLYDYHATYSETPTEGRLTGTRTWVDGSQYTQTSLHYDSFGNVDSQTAYTGYGTESTAPQSGAQTTAIVYDSIFHTYPISITNPLGQTTTLGYDYNNDGTNDFILGVPTSETGPNGAATKVEATYDVFGRLTKLIRPGDSSVSPTLSIAYVSNPFTVTLTQKINDTQNYVIARQYDGLGRPTLVTTNNSMKVGYTYSYENGVRVDKQSMPYTGTTATDWMKVEYDSLARPLNMTAPDETVTSYAYDGLETTVTDANGNATSSLTNILGQTRSVTPPEGTGPGVTFTYDPLGNLKFATRGGATVSMSYDKAGRKTGMSDPDMGNWGYEYDALGNLKTQTDARGCTLTMNYDDLNRLDTKVSSGTCGQNVNVDYNYDSTADGNYGIGFRTSMTDGSGSTTWKYDTRGRVEREVKTITGHSAFETIFTYNSADLPITMEYPDGEVVITSYDNRMLPISVAGNANYASMDYDTAGRMTSRSLGNGVTQKFIFNPWDTEGGRLEKIVAGTGTWDLNTQLFTTTLQKSAYSYDPVGNITSIYDSMWGETQTFGYDELNRLVSATAEDGLANYSEIYTYDSGTGNLLTKGDLTGISPNEVGEYKLNYDANHPHAVGSLVESENESNEVGSYEYDSNGNMESRDFGGQEVDLGYDAENRLVSVTGTNLSAQFTYNGDGQRVKSVINGNETTYFAGGHFELKVTTDTQNNTTSEVTKSYFAGASRIAVRKYIVPQTTTLTYLLGDHLGSTSLAVDASTGDVVETRYKPWGEVRFTTTGETLPTRYTFTGQYSYMDDEATDLGAAGFGLMFYNARWYDPMTGRFAQADSIVTGGVQGLDRYAYVNNSPVNYIDPTGHFSAGAIENYVIRECSKGLDPEADEEEIYQCYDETLTAWQDDGEWWNMLLDAQKGDVLFGSCLNFQGNCGWTATFEGAGNNLLTGITVTGNNPIGFGPPDMTLNDIQGGVYNQGSVLYGAFAPRSKLTWYGFYRPSTISGKSGAPEWHLRASLGIKVVSNGPSSLVTIITEEGVATGGGAIAADVCEGVGGSLVCGVIGFLGGSQVSDMIDTQSIDYHYQVGPLYFNFQCVNCSSPDGRYYILEYIDYNP